ncbi:MAG: hypothetical protein WC244_00815 [Patescibacteria group bacterium]|jgi:hypothetical protein
MPDKVATNKTPSTQSRMHIAEIRDDCVVLKDGTLRAVLLVSSINFALKSEDEQSAIISGYISFLNLLDSPLQILVQSRKLDLDEYLVSIKEAEKIQTNELLKLQISEYYQYISQLVELGDIMTKRFYVVVPYDPSSNGKRGFWARTGDVLSPTNIISLGQKQFSQRHRDLFTLLDKILSGLSGMGLRATVLDTQSLIELFYNTYNPVVSRSEKLGDVDKLKLEENNYV